MNKLDSRQFARDTACGRGDTMRFVEAHGYDKSQIAEVSRVTWVGVAVNIALAVVKAAAGLFAKSNVLIADAVHTLSDLATDMAILVGVRYWSAPADASHPHGHRKIETMITLAIGVALALVGLGLGYEAVAELARAVIAGRETADAPRMGLASAVAAIVAAVSIASKELLYRWTAAEGVRLGSSAVVANAWHHRSDAISSIPPLLAIVGEMIGARLGYNLWYLDPIGTIIVCVMLLEAAWDVVQPTLAALVDASADRRLCSAIRQTVLDTGGVIDAHKIRTRVICANAVAVDLHIIVDRNLTVEQGHDISSNVRDRLLALDPHGDAKPVDVIVHIEPGDPMDKPLPAAEKNTAVDWKPIDDEKNDQIS